jgi:dTDP-4-amino-4,6-dideoxygalactose transaminase
LKYVSNRGAPRKVFLSPPHMCGEELRFVKEAFESNYIAPLGPMVDAFEQEFAEKVGIAHAVALSSGTAAMHLALRILGVGPGDEVIASTLTFIGSVTPIVFQGATPVFVDADRETWNMDPDLLDQEIMACAKRGKLPKAVVPTDLYGQCADLSRIREICEPYGIPVISDSAEALGARYLSTTDERRHAQTFSSARPAEEALSSPRRKDTPSEWHHAGRGAKAAVFSFNGNKSISTSGGGMLASDDGGLIEQARFLSQQARDAAPHYEHSTIGYNYRMSNVLAAIFTQNGLEPFWVTTISFRCSSNAQDALLSSPVAIYPFQPWAVLGKCCRPWLIARVLTLVSFESYLLWRCTSRKTEKGDPEKELHGGQSWCCHAGYHNR